MQPSERLATGLVLAMLLLGFFIAPWRAPEDPPGNPSFFADAPSLGPSPSLSFMTFPAIADAFIAGKAPDRNFGLSRALAVGGDPSNSTAYRGLARFDLSTVPMPASIVNATLRARVAQGTAGSTVDVHRVRASWFEGTGREFSYRQTVTVTESAGVSRTREPIDLQFDLPVSLSTFVASDFRVYDESDREVPSQVYGAVYAGPTVTQVHVVFSASVGAFGTRQYSLYYGTFVPTVPTFRTKPLGNFMWSYPAGARYASLTAADLNGDGRLEVLVGSSDTYLYAIQWNSTLLWKHKAADAIGFFATAVDVDGDGSLEVVYATDGTAEHKIYALSADGTTEKWNTSVYPENRMNAPIAISDVDGNGVKTLFVGALDKYLYAFYGNNGTLRWRVPLPATALGYGAAVGNLTDDSAPEIVYTADNGDYYAVRRDGSVRWIGSPSGRSSQVTPSLGDLNRDGVLDVVSGDNFNNGKQFVMNGTDGSTLWVTTTGSSQFGGQVLVDFQNTRWPWIVLSMTSQNSLGFMDSNGTLVRTFVTGGNVWGVPAVADVTMDGVPEILIGSFDNNLYVVDSTGNEVGRFLAPDWVSATPIVADLDDDGTMEIVFSSRSITYAYSTGSLGHDFRTGGYNYNLTGRFLDGNSPDGAPLLRQTLGPVQSLGGTGVTWRSRDGSFMWASPGSDYDASVVASAAVTGSDRWLSWNVTSLVQSWTNQTLPNAGVLFKVQSEAIASLTTLSSREADPSFVATLDIQYYDNVKPQILTRIPDQIAAEDSPMWGLDLAGFAADPDTSLAQLRWDLAGVNTNLFDYSGGNQTGGHILYFQPKPNAWSNNLVDLFLFDPEDHYAVQPLWVNITPVDDAPTFVPPTILLVKYGSPYTFDFSPYIDDVDTPKAALRLRSDDLAHTTVSGLRVTFSYPSNYPDQWAFLVLTVDDGELTNAQSLAIRLTTDAPPELRVNLPDVTLLEGQAVQNAFDLDNYFIDPDNDILFFTYGFTHLTVLINTDHTVDIEALGEFYGNESVTFRATDPAGAITEDTILVTVIPVNDPPVIAYFPDFVVHYDSEYVFDLSPYVSDPDTPMSQVIVSTSLPGYVRVQETILRLLFPRVLGNRTAPYTISITVYANDGLAIASRVTNVTVGNDYPPQLVPGEWLPDVFFNEDAIDVYKFNLDAYFFDNDSAAIFYTYGAVEVTAKILLNHSVYFSAAANWSGVERVTFRAMDGSGAYAEDTIKVTVLAVNDPPYFKNLPVASSDVPTFLFDLRNFVDDVDTNVSQLKLNTTNQYVRVEGFLLVFTYPNGAREDDVTLILSDGKATATANLQVRITTSNLFMVLLPWLAILAAVAAAFFVVRQLKTVVEHVFLIYGGGIPLAHLSRNVTMDKDPDLVASMFTAIQSFMNESFHSMGVGELKSLELADHRVALVRGEFVLLVVLYRGTASGHIERRANEAVREIERRFRDVLEDWNGDVDRIAGLRAFLERLYGAQETGRAMGSLMPPEVTVRIDTSGGKR